MCIRDSYETFQNDTPIPLGHGRQHAAGARDRRIAPFFRDRKLTLYLAVETALFLLLLLVCQLAYGGDWLITFMVVHPLPLHDCGSRVSTNHSSSEPAHHLLYLETPDWC